MGFFRTFRRGVTLSSVGLAATAAVLTVRHYLETPQPLESALGGDGRIDRRHGGDIYYNIAGPTDGQPVLLLHDFYPGASNFEYRRLYPRLAERYRVYAPDWLGFGMSEHPHVAYTGEFYATMLTGFLRDVIGQPTTVVAHGHAANVAVRAASDAPDLFERLVLVEPDVFAGLRSDPTPSQAITRATQRAFLGIVPYALLSSKPALRWMTFSRSSRLHDAAATEERVEHLYASAHQFGGQHALLAFLTGELDLPMQNAFALLEPPVLILAGEQDRRHPPVDLEDIAVLNPYAELVVIAGAGDPINENRPEPVVNALTSWLAAPRDRHAADDALLYPMDALEEQLPAEPSVYAPAESAVEGAAPEDETKVVSGGIKHAGDDVTPIVLPTEGATTPERLETTDEVTPTDELMTGTPGAVVPGVSDMGLEGLSTPEVDGIAALDDEGVSLGQPEQRPSAEGSRDESIAEMLPEAGDVSPENDAEREARAGVEPPSAPATNIGYAESSSDEGTAAPTGDVAGPVEVVQTPEATADAPEADISTSENATPTAEDAVDTVDTAEMMDVEKDITGAPTTPARRSGPNSATRTARREASPRSEPGTRAGASRTKRASTGGSSKAQPRGRQTGQQTGSRKRNRPSSGS